MMALNRLAKREMRQLLRSAEHGRETDRPSARSLRPGR
jgi:hypothetical protein